MTFKEIIALFEEHKESDEYKNYVKGLTLTPDRVKEFLDSEEGKKLVQPSIDSHFSKSLETWKSNNLDKLIDEEIKKRNPSADPKDLELEKIRKQLEDIQKESTRKDLMNKALKVATEKKLPTNLMEYFVLDDEESTIKNIETFEKVFTESVSNRVEEKLKNNAHIPFDSDDDKPINGVEKAFMEMTGLKEIR